MADRETSPLGLHRILDPGRVLPQQAWRLDPSPPVRKGERLVDVELLNVDSASWQQLREVCDDDPEAIGRRVEDIVSERGKLHNPVTGSGGVLAGRIKEVGEGGVEGEVGKRIITLASLTLTPLRLERVEVHQVRKPTVRVEGQAILTERLAFGFAPADLSLWVAIQVLDVCGAPAQVARYTFPGARVAVIGAGGKSGLLALAEAARTVGNEGQVVGVFWPPDSARSVEDWHVTPVLHDATDGVATSEKVREAFDGRCADLVVVCTSVRGCEAAAILSCRDGGNIIFFSMATSFSSAALIAEGISSDCRMIIGNGFSPGHAERAIELVRGSQFLYQAFSAGDVDDQ